MSIEAFRVAGQQIGLNENDQNTVLREFMANGGVNLDPAVTAWCAGFVNAALNQTGGQGTGSLAARSFMDWGNPTDSPNPGDIAVFSRGNPSGPYGHVGFFQGYDDAGNVLVLGGNQSDSVSVAPYSADRLLGFRTAGTGTAAQAPTNALSGGSAPSGDNALAALQQNQSRTNTLDPSAFMSRHAFTFTPVQV
jgi:uncharacterized protein (TIGR02594 family)